MQYKPFRTGCALCAGLADKENGDLLFESHEFSVYRGPFAANWPGAIMAVYHGHKLEMSELPVRVSREILSQLTEIERTVRSVTTCAKINFVKFGNVSEHLHWHIIPRYNFEKFPQKTPWEIPTHQKLSVQEVLDTLKTYESLEHLYKSFQKKLQENLKKRKADYFSCALFLRPQDWQSNSDFRDMSIHDIILNARQSPDTWECLLMQRNYRDFAWDHFGGGADSGEFPERALEREVFEETGWRIRVYEEVTRQWSRVALRGFVYVVIPAETEWMVDNPPRVHCDEVKGAQYYSLTRLANDEIFPKKVNLRIQSFLAGTKDFIVE